MPEIDFYCERTTSHWFDEPFGLLSNLLFILAALHQLNRQGHWSAGAKFLVALLFAIGLGSALFHTFATHTTLLLDVIPINLFIISAMWILLRAHIGLGIPTTVLAITLVLGTSAVMPRDVLNGSAGYLPSFAALLAISTFHSPGRAGTFLWWATLLFPVSITFRSVDNLLCQVVPIGTHFVWHAVNAVVLWCLIEAVRRNADDSSASNATK